MRVCKVDLLVVCSRKILVVFVLLCGGFPSAASSEGVSLSWPGRLGLLGEEAVRCLTVSPELELQIKDRLGKGDIYTTACRITESLVVLLAEHGGNGDPLGVLDIQRQDGPIELLRGLPWIERTLKDKSGVLHIVVGGATLSDGHYGSIVSIYSTRTWKQTVLARKYGIETWDGVLECPEQGGYGYGTIEKVVQETHRYEDQDGDGFEDIIVETVETSCSTHKSKTLTEVFLATEQGFKKATRAKPSRKTPSRA